MLFLNTKIKQRAVFLLEIYSQIVVSIDYLDVLENNIEKDIFNSYKEIKNISLDSIIKDMDIDLINNKEGIRTELLKDNGIFNIFDLKQYSFDDLNSINGIGAAYASLIIKNRNYIIHKVDQTIDFRFPEEFDKLYLPLLRYIYIKRNSQNLIAEIKKLTEINSIKVHYPYLKINTGFFKYVFSGLKKEADSSFKYFDELAKGSFNDKIGRLIDEYNSLIKTKDEIIYADFKNNVASYYAVVDKYNTYVPNINDYLVEKIEKIPLNQRDLKCNLRNYQIFGSKFILNEPNVLLGDEMGLGKTIQAIAVINHLIKEGKSNILIIVPLAVLTNWHKEIKINTSYEINIIYKNNLVYAPNMINLTTFETLNKFEVNNRLDFCVVDEAHLIKNKNTLRSKNTVNLLNKADKILLMSGTPLENNVDEFLYLISLLNKKTADEVSGYKNLLKVSIFKEKLSNIYLRRKRSEVLKELPSLIEKNEWCILNEEELSLYHASLMSNNFMQVRRVSFNAVNSNKVNRILDLVDNFKLENRKVVIFSYFLDTLARLEKEMADDCAGVLKGNVSINDRDKILEEFKVGIKPVMLCQIQSGGLGLNIQNASVVIICEPQLKPSIENQAISRVYRMGQNKKVFIHRILMDDTIDEYIMNILDKKTFIFNEFVDESYLSSKAFEKNLIEEEIKKLALR